VALVNKSFPKGLLMRATNEKFVDMGQPRRVWAVGAIHGDLDRLMTLHDHLAARFSVGDRLVYLGNYAGAKSERNIDVFEELLAFRAALLAKPGVDPADIVHLRGPAEEAWQRLLRLQFVPNPAQTMDHLHEAGVDAYLRMYEVSVNDTRTIARAGSTAITRWTNRLRDMQRKSAGHDALICSTRRAAYSDKILFVPAGFDSSLSLENQGDGLWNGWNFGIGGTYTRIVRGFDPGRMGIHTEGFAVTLDGGCGFGGPLACGCFEGSGRLLEIVATGGLGAIETLPTLPDFEPAFTEERPISATLSDIPAVNFAISA
jgi:hypothetical protein